MHFRLISTKIFTREQGKVCLSPLNRIFIAQICYFILNLKFKGGFIPLITVYKVIANIQIIF